MPGTSSHRLLNSLLPNTHPSNWHCYWKQYPVAYHLWLVWSQSWQTHKLSQRLPASDSWRGPNAKYRSISYPWPLLRAVRPRNAKYCRVFAAFDAWHRCQAKFNGSQALHRQPSAKQDSRHQDFNHQYKVLNWLGWFTMNHTLHIQIVSFGLVVATCNETKNVDFGVLACVFSRSLSLSGGHPVWTLTCTLNSHEIHSSSDFPRLAICSQTQVCGFVTQFHSVLQTQNMSKHISSIAFSKPFVKLFIVRRAKAVPK